MNCVEISAVGVYFEARDKFSSDVCVSRLLITFLKCRINFRQNETDASIKLVR